MNMNAFKTTLINEDYMIKYLECENIITDFTNLDMSFAHFESEVLELFEQYSKYYMKNQEKHSKNKKSASYIYKFDNADSVKPFRDLQSSFGVLSDNFQNISDIDTFIGFDTQRYFALDESSLIVCK
jgi:hypothetical protein